MITLTCPQCKQMFVVPHYIKRKFCSQRCGGLFSSAASAPLKKAWHIDMREGRARNEVARIDGEDSRNKPMPYAILKQWPSSGGAVMDIRIKRAEISMGVAALFTDNIVSKDTRQLGTDKPATKATLRLLNRYRRAIIESMSVYATQHVMQSTCVICGVMMTRKPKEKLAYFASKETCTRSCAATQRAQKRKSASS